jgi:hypothetical protein
MSHEAATSCIQVPRFETTDAIQIARKTAIRSGLQGDGAIQAPRDPDLGPSDGCEVVTGQNLALRALRDT